MTAWKSMVLTLFQVGKANSSLKLLRDLGSLGGAVGYACESWYWIKS